MGRGNVVGNAPRRDAMQPQLGEAKGNNGPRRLGGVAATPLIGREFVADVSFERVDGLARACRLAPGEPGHGKSDAAVTDEALRIFQRDRQLKLGARQGKLLREEHLHELLHVLRRTIDPVGVTQITRIALVGQHGGPIRFDEFAQDQTIGGELHGGSFRLRRLPKFDQTSEV